MSLSRFFLLVWSSVATLLASVSALGQVPTITSVSPLAAPAGGTILLEGIGFLGTEEVVFNDRTSGENRVAAYSVISDAHLRVTVPSGTPGRTAMLTVRTAGGATVTFAENIPERPAGETLSTSATGAALITHGTVWIGTTASALYFKPGATGDQNSNRHYNTFYVDEGAILVGLGGSNNWVYHTPNAVIGWNAPGANHRVIPVAALSISRLPELFNWVESTDSFTLTAEVEGPGVVVVDPEKESYLENEAVTVRAIPAEGYGLMAWSGDVELGNRPPEVSMDRDRSVKAHFAPAIEFALDVVGGGTVDQYPDAEVYGFGAEVTLTPQPKLGWSFGGWTGDALGEAVPLNLTLDAPKSIGAKFLPGVVQWGRMNNDPSVPAPALTDIVAVAAGGYHNLALRADGTVFSWTTANVDFAPVPPAGLANVVAIAAGDEHGLALRGNGSVVGWGKNNTVPEDLSEVVAIAAGSGHSLALKADGSVVAWGWNEYGQCNVPPGLADVVAISGGHSFSLALRADGTVVGWGEAWLLPPAGMTDVVSISAGMSHSLALKEDGTIVGWGRASNGRTTHPVGLTDVVAIGAGARHSIALRSDGTVHQWGDTSWIVEGVPSALAGVGAISAGMSSNVVLLRPEAPPHVTVMPQIAAVSPGQKVVLSTHAHGVGSLSYQWKKGNEEIPGAIAPFLVLENVVEEDFGSYSVVVSNQYGWVESAASSVVDTDTVTVTVDAINGQVAVDPAATVYTKGTAVTLTASPDAGYRFVGWMGGVFSLQNPLSVTLEENLQLTAVFQEISVTELATIIDAEPPIVPVGGTLRLHGNGFLDATGVYAVTAFRIFPFLSSDAAGASFSILSDELLEVTIPNDHANDGLPIPLLVKTSAGVTAVGAHSPFPLSYDPNYPNPQFDGHTFVLTTGAEALPRTNRSIIYLRSGASFTGELAGNNIVLIEAGASFTGTLTSRNAIFVAEGAHFQPVNTLGAEISYVSHVPNVSLSLLPTMIRVGPVPMMHSVTTAVEGNGTLEVWPPRLDRLYAGETVTLTATPAEGERFFGWSGSYASAEHEFQFSVDGDTALTAHFAIPRTLTTAVIGSGSVRRSPDGDVYPDGQAVTLTANPENGWTFVGWEGDLPDGTNPQVIEMTEDRSVTARFMRPQTITFPQPADRHFEATPFDLSVSATSGLKVEVEVVSGPALIEGTRVTLTGAGRVTIRATQTGDETWIASSVVERTFVSGYRINAQVGSGGSIMRQPIKNFYEPGDSVLLTAVASDGYRFLGWEGGIESTLSTETLIMNGDHSVTAGFVRVWNLSITSTTGGTVSVEPEQTQFDDGETVTLTATPKDGFEFTGWSGSVASSENPLAIEMKSPTTVQAHFQDAAAPVVLITAPVAGTTRDERFTLSGSIADNDGVKSAVWSWNGEEQGLLSLGEDGSFEVKDLMLISGENVIVVTARDAAGNESSATVRPVWRPGIRLFAEGSPEVQEGLRLVVPILLESGGEVAGMTFTLGYDPVYLGDPQVEWSEDLGAAFRQVNVATAGEIFVTFSLPGSTLSQGEQQVIRVSFRVRSLPETLGTMLTLDVHDASDPVGNAFPYGIIAEGCEAALGIRNFLGDNNGNDRLDIGDATIIQRLISGLMERRSWDVSGNDLNQNTFLDSGDVTRVLRAVASIDPQPKAIAPTSILVSESDGLMMKHAAFEVIPSSTTPERMVFSEVIPEIIDVNGTVTVQVRLLNTVTPVAGVSFVIEYDTTALRLRDNAAHRISSMIPAGTMALWNVEPGQNDYNLQSGRLHFAAAREDTWSLRSGTVAEVTFDVQPGARLRAEWPVWLTQVEITGDGFDVRQLPDVQGSFQLNLPDTKSFAVWISEQEEIDPSLRGAGEDGRGNGISNLLAYALGRAEGAPEQGRLPTLERALEGDEEHLSIQFRIPSHVRGIRYFLEASDDLAIWESLPFRSRIVGIEPDGSVRISLRDSIPLRDRQNRFLRLRVEE